MARKNANARQGRRRYRNRSDKFHAQTYLMMVDDDGNPDTMVRFVAHAPDDHFLVELPDGSTIERHMSRFFTAGGF